MTTEIIFVIDKSGSMARLTNDTIGGFNSFIEEQKAQDNNITLTTILFNTDWNILHDGVNIHNVKPMTINDYKAYGGTAILDAIGEIINKVQDRHDELGNEKPDKVLFVITTDGEENSSQKFTKKQIKKIIKHQTNGHGWNFMFLGANMDAVKCAGDIGIQKDWAINTVNTTDGVIATYKTVTMATNAVKTDVKIDLQNTYNTTI